MQLNSESSSLCWIWCWRGGGEQCSGSGHFGGSASGDPDPRDVSPEKFRVRSIIDRIRNAATADPPKKRSNIQKIHKFTLCQQICYQAKPNVIIDNQQVGRTGNFERIQNPDSKKIAAFRREIWSEPRLQH